MKAIYVPCKDKEEAKNISRSLITKRLAKCTNIFPIESIYQWKGKVVEEKEYVMLVKTIDEKGARKEIKKLHSYEVPAILSFEMKGNLRFEEWLRR